MAGKNNQIKSPAVQPRAEEVTLVADFPSPWGNDVKSEIIGMDNSVNHPTAAIIWAPSTDDFFEIAETDIRDKKAIRLVKTFGNFLAELQSFTPGTIQRVNLITHAVGGLISFGGTTQRDGKVFFNKVKVDDPVKSGGIDSDFIDMLNGILVPNGSTPEDGKGIRDDIRSRFRPDGEFILYGCGGASGTGVDLFIQFTLCFNIKASGFREHIDIQPTFDQKRNIIVSRNQTRYENKPPKARLGPFLPGFKHMPPDFPQGKPVKPSP